MNGTSAVEYLDTLDEREGGLLVAQTTDGREIVYGSSYPVKIKEVNNGR